MKITIIKASGRALCRGPRCEKKPEFVKDNGNIIKDSRCAKVSIWGAQGGSTAFYCRDCIDKLYEDVRKILNPKLWVFQ